MREKATSSPSIDEYLKAPTPSSHKETDDLVKEKEEEEKRRSKGGAQEESTTIKVDKKQQLEEVDSLELKPQPKQIKNDDTRLQQLQRVSESSKLPTKVSTQLVAKGPHKDTKSTRDAGGKRKGGGRGKRKTNPSTRASDGDFVPSSRVSR